MSFLDFVHELDACSTLVLIGILTFVGSKLVEQRPALQQWGKRFAYGTLLLYLAAGFVHLSPSSGEEFLLLTVRALMAAGLMLGLTWIVLPATAWVYEHTIGALLADLRSWRATSTARARERREHRERDAARRRADEEYRRSAPERERQRQESEARARTEAAAQRRRVDARARCDLLYNTFAHDIEKRFTRAMYDDFASKYMTDQFSAEDVERRAKELEAVIEQHRQAVKPTTKPKTISELADWFVGEKQRIEALPLSDDLKEEYIAKLEGRHSELTQQILEKIQP